MIHASIIMNIVIDLIDFPNKYTKVVKTSKALPTFILSAF